MKVTITETGIAVETGNDEQPYDPVNGIDWTCRLATHEAVAWATKRLGEELEKSVQFYRTGKVTDTISID